MATIAERNIIFKIQTDTANARKGVEKISKDVTGLSGLVRNATANFASLAAFDVAGRITGGLKSIADQTIRLAIGSEQTNVAFETFLGSAQKAAEVVAQLKQFSALTPFEPEQVLQAGKALLAFGVAAEDLEPTLKAVGDLSAGTGKDFNELAVIFGKAKTQGVLFAEDINQLTESGIPVIQEFAKQLGVSEGAVKKLASEGKISFSNLEQAFQDLTSEGGRFFDLTAKQSQTVGGRISTLVGNFNELLTVIGTSLLPVIGGLVDTFGSFVGLTRDYIQLKPSKEIEEEQLQLNVLVDELTDANTSQARRSQLISDIQKQYPNFLKNIDAETVSNNELKKALNEGNEAFAARIALEIAQEEFSKAQNDRTVQTRAAINAENNLRKELNKVIIENNLQEKVTSNTLQGRVNDVRNAIGADEKQIATLRRLNGLEQFLAIERERQGIFTDDAVEAESELEATRKRLQPLLEIFNSTFRTEEEVVTGATNAIEETNKAEEKLANARAKRLAQLLESGDELSGSGRDALNKEATEAAKEAEAAGKKRVDAIQKELEADGERAKAFIENQQEIKFAADISAAEFDKQQEAEIQALDEVIAKEADLQAKREENAKKAIDIAVQTTNAVLDIARGALQTEIELLDARIEAQQERISAAVKVAERGNAELLQSEEDRLIALTNAREKAAERQARIAQIEAAANQLVAVSQGIVAVTKGFTENIFVGIATSAALAIQVAAIIASINNSANSVQGFADGTEFVHGAGGSRSDSIPARLSRGERVVPAHINSKYYNALNEFQYATPKADIMADLLNGGGRGNTTDMSVVEGQLMQMNERLDSLEMNVSLDQDGFSASLQKFQTKQTRKNKLL